MITTKKHFELFVKECKYWIDKFGIKGWDIEFTHKSLCDENKAGISWKIMSRIASINLEPKWGEKQELYKTITDKVIRKTAFHEVCELLLGRLAMMADCKISNYRDAVEEETHNIIRIFENTVFEDSLIAPIRHGKLPRY
jgi:hypothetical protein